MHKFEATEIFLSIVNEGSLTAAAKSLKLSKGYVSQQLKLLEENIGAPLLTRSTRKITLTEAGQVYYHRCQPLLDEFHQAEQEASEIHNQAKGLLRVCLPNLFGGRFVVPKIGPFLKQHPDLNIELYFSGKRVDMAAEGFDLSIVIGEVCDPNVVATAISSTRFFLCASNGYIQQHGMPSKLQELNERQGITFIEQGVSKPWLLCNGVAEHKIQLQSRWFCNSGHAILEAVEQGLGIAYLPDYYLPRALANKELQLILPQWCQNERKIYLVYGDTRFIPLKVRLLIDYLKPLFETPIWQSSSFA